MHIQRGEFDGFIGFAVIIGHHGFIGFIGVLEGGTIAIAAAA